MYTAAAPRSTPNCSDRPNVAVPILLKRRIHATKMLLSIVKKLKKLTGLNGFTCARIINCVMIALNARRLKHSLNKDNVLHPHTVPPLLIQTYNSPVHAQ